METELKFALSSDARERVERRRLKFEATAETPETHRDQTVYFDTPDLALKNAGFTLRVRHCSDSDRFVQTVKARRNGALQRDEWEWPVPSGQPELRHLSEVQGLPAPLRSPGLVLASVFETDVQRAVEVVESGNGAKVEVAFDHGTIASGANSLPLSELELELKEGGVDSLLRLGLEFLRAAPLALMSESKAAPRCHLPAGSLPQATKAPAIELDVDADVRSAFRVLVACVLDHLMANQPAAIRGEQVEGVHQMRVAIRPVRSLLMPFDPCLEPRRAGRFEAEHKRLAAVRVH